MSLDEDIRRQLAKLLGMNVEDDISTDDEVLSRLNQLNDVYKDVIKQRETLETRRENVMDEISRYNQLAKEHIRNGNENQARESLRRKKDKMDKLSNIDGKISKIRKKEEEIQEQRERLEKILMNKPRD